MVCDLWVGIHGCSAYGGQKRASDPAIAGDSKLSGIGAGNSRVASIL